MIKLSETCKSRFGKPLQEYSSEEEALDAVIYVKNNYGNEVEPYFCNYCGNWHLATKNRKTPSIQSECLDSNGNFKQLYPTEEAAQRRANILLEEQGKKLYVYRCLFCNGYHLTHKKNKKSF